MALVKNNQFGQVYEFGLQDADAPVVAGMKVRRIEIQYAAEVTEKANDGEGHVESVTTSKPDKRMASARCVGYIHDIGAYRTASATFTFAGRFYIIESVTEPRQAGKYVEGEVSAYSHAGVTS